MCTAPITKARTKHSRNSIGHLRCDDVLIYHQPAPIALRRAVRRGAKTDRKIYPPLAARRPVRCPSLRSSAPPRRRTMALMSHRELLLVKKARHNHARPAPGAEQDEAGGPFRIPPPGPGPPPPPENTSLYNPPFPPPPPPPPFLPPTLPAVITTP